MKKQSLVYFVLTLIFVFSIFSCDNMATLFHGPKPEKTYTVIFDANSASGTAPAAQTVSSGTVISLPDKGALTNPGNVFVGWCESAGGSGAIYSVGSSISVKKDMVFYAQWLDGSTPQYTVTFNANGATGGFSPSAQTVYSGISITVPGQGTLAYSGKVFGGWNTQSNGGGTNYVMGATFTVTGNVTLYAKWNSAIQYTVTYHANGASSTVPTKQTVDPGTVITLPGQESMSYTGRIFKGWNTLANGSGTNYDEGDSYTVTANATLYAQWESVPIVPPGTTLADQLAYIRNNAGDGLVYDIVVNNNEYLNPTTVSTMGRNITVNIHSANPVDVKTIYLNSPGYLFSVDGGVVLKLHDIVLRGISTNNSALVAVGSGTLILNSGTKITQNTNITYRGKGGGIYVNGGILEMNNGAEIIGNIGTANIINGGGIYVENYSSVTIRGGVISENYINSSSDEAFGGGIYIGGYSTVTMSGGIISKNSALGSRYRQGGGIYVTNGSSFTKRAASGSSTSGIIYGGGTGDSNIAVDGGHVIYRNFGMLKNRNTTLGGYDEISTVNDVGWE